MTDYFDRCVAFVLKHEGGYVNDIHDAGGETNYGISKKAYPELDIKALTVVDATEIYRRDYWQRAGCDKMEWPLCLIVFDTAVNMGVGRAQEFNAKALNWSDFIFMRLERNEAKAQSEFLRGLLKRAIDLWKEAKAPTDEHPVSTADSSDGQRPRASGRNRVMLREPERCVKCNQQFLSFYPLSVCAEHDGLDRV